MKLKDEKTLKQIGKRIRHFRDKQKLSQDQLAYEAGIPRKQISRIELGHVNTGILNLVAIAKVLDVSVKEFFN